MLNKGKNKINIFQPSTEAYKNIYIISHFQLKFITEILINPLLEGKSETLVLYLKKKSW